MVAERGPLVKAQLSCTHALCSHAPNKKQKHTSCTWRKVWEILFQSRNFPIISVTYSKNSSAMRNRKDITKTLLGQILTRSAVTMRLNLFKFWNLTHKKGYSPFVWIILTFNSPLLFLERWSHFNSRTIFWSLSYFFWLVQVKINSNIKNIFPGCWLI